MAVPKKKTSKSKRNMRRSHHALKAVNVVLDATTGEYKLPHHISLSDGFYNGRQVIVESDNSNDNEDAA
jgi:large subunit ribosomal protein L32